MLKIEKYLQMEIPYSNNKKSSAVLVLWGDSDQDMLNKIKEAAALA